MKSFIVTDGKHDYTLNLPTKLEEITDEYLKEVTSHIKIAPYHAVIANVYRCKLPEIISSNKKSRAMAIAIIPVFVKASVPMNVEEATFNMFANLKCGDRIIISGTDVERGNHLSAPTNFITIENIVKIYNNDDKFAKGVMSDQSYYYFVDFKLVTINDIKGYYSNDEVDTSYENPFVKVNVNEEAN